MKFNAELLRQKARPSTPEEIRNRREQIINAPWLNRSTKIALRIRKELRLQGLSQSDLARLIGVTPAAITKILSGKENLSLQTICKVEEALGTQIICTTPTTSQVQSQVYSYGMEPMEQLKLAESKPTYGDNSESK